MLDTATREQMQAVHRLLGELGHVKIAVSGGVDSLTLGLLAHRHPDTRARMYHAVSSAVPPAATERVRATAEAEDWDLRVIDAGEMQDEDYLKNPYRRCFHCKKNLYGSLARQLSGNILSGTNSDDLGDFRPGLQAAEQFSVRHPFVECAVDKACIRRICRHLGYADLAALPASPCLSSRVETGVRIESPVLGFIDRVENLLRDQLKPDVVRCRVRHDTISIQLDPASLTALSTADTGHWSERIRKLATPLGLPADIRFEHYRMGSAFVELT